MLVLVSVFLLTLLASIIAVWMFRLLLSWYSHVQSQVNTPRPTSWLKLVNQQGLVSFLSAPKERVKVTKLRRSTANIKSPWGW